MNMRTVLIAAAVIALILGFAFVLGPAYMATLYAMGTDLSDVLNPRSLGLT